jgi:hypothetical protein
MSEDRQHLHDDLHTLFKWGYSDADRWNIGSIANECAALLQRDELCGYHYND